MVFFERELRILTHLHMTQITQRSCDKRLYLHQINYGNKWSAHHAMELDYEGRLWAATITQSGNTFWWHVIDEIRTQLERLKLLDRRANRTVFFQIP